MVQCWVAPPPPGGNHHVTVRLCFVPRQPACEDVISFNSAINICGFGGLWALGALLLDARSAGMVIWRVRSGKADVPVGYDPDLHIFRIPLG